MPESLENKTFTCGYCREEITLTEFIAGHHEIKITLAPEWYREFWTCANKDCAAKAMEEYSKVSIEAVEIKYVEN